MPNKLRIITHLTKPTKKPFFLLNHVRSKRKYNGKT